MDMAGNKIIGEVSPYLARKSSILFTLARDLVTPEFSTRIPTAAVGFGRENARKCIKFLFNQTFWGTLNYTEKCFVFVHEVLHVLLDHGQRGEEFLKTLPAKKRSRKLLNIAMDIAINEIALEQYIDAPMSAMPVLNAMPICLIETVFKDFAPLILRDKSFEYYYLKYQELFPAVDSPPGMNSLDSHESMGEAMSPEEQEAMQEAVGKALGKKNGEGAGLTEETLKEAEEEAAKGGNGYTDKGYNGDAGPVTMKPESVKDKLERTLNIQMAKTFGRGPAPRVKHDWNSVNRRTIGVQRMSPNLFIPVRKEIPNKMKYRIRAYCDVSGSCRAVSAKFLMLLNDLDSDKYDLETFVFADNVGKTTRQRDGSHTYPNVGAGTSIGAVRRHAKHEAKDHVDAIFVLTDGEYENVRGVVDAEYSNWTFYMMARPEWRTNHPKQAKMVELKL